MSTNLLKKNNPLGRRKLVSAQRSKNVFSCNTGDQLILSFKDEETHPSLGEYTISGKGAINNRLSALLLSRLEELDIPTHYLDTLNMREQIVLRTEPFPVKIVVHNYADTEFAQTYNVEVQTKLSRPIVEYRLKAKEDRYPVLSSDHITSLGLAEEDDMEALEDYALRINDFIRGQCLGAGYRLMNLSLEVARLPEGEFQLSQPFIIVDELTPHTLTLYDLEQGRFVGKADSYLNKEDLTQDYKILAYRFGLISPSLSTSATGDLPHGNDATPG